MNHHPDIKTHFAGTRWAKLSGAGNCFLITHQQPPLELSYWKKLSPFVCQAQHTHGLVVLEQNKNPNKEVFNWLFYNADGSQPGMCGNAACCVIDYIIKSQLTARSSVTLNTRAGQIKGEWKKGKSQVFFPLPSKTQGPLNISFKGEGFSYTFIDSLVPHGVIEQDFSLPPNPPHKERAMWLRHKPHHHKEGMNVSLYHPLSSPNKDSSVIKLKAISFERGVEDFTPACGTGAVAVAAAYRFCHHSPASIFQIQMPGGILTVCFHTRHITLESPVKWHPLSAHEQAKLQSLTSSFRTSDKLQPDAGS